VRKNKHNKPQCTVGFRHP